jgi:galactose mutarotase-like enzyme
MTKNKYIGHPLQLSGVEEYRLLGGKGDGMHLLRIRNGLGIDMTISADRCSDISELYFDGCRINYTSPCGYVNSQYYHEDNDGLGFLKSFNCGMITTCGLQNIGVPNEANGKFHGLHGTIGNTPADYIYYETLDDVIYVHATMRDQIMFGAKLTLHRTISISLTDNKIAIEDEVINEGSTEEPIMFLYHINVGYPLLDENTTLEINSSNVIPRDAHAAKDMDTWNKMLRPIPNFSEQCYYHKFEESTAKISVHNKTIQKGLELSFDTSIFPEFVQWKMMGEHDYVLGIEPCTNTLDGRNAIREKQQLITLKPGESKKFGAQIKLFRTN